MNKNQLRRDEHAAATELGYIFTFLLGVLLLTTFSIWAYQIETATRERSSRCAKISGSSRSSSRIQ